MGSYKPSAAGGLCGNHQDKKRLRNLSDASRFYYRGPALTLREARGFVLICVYAAELLTIGVVNANQPMVVFAAAVSAKCILVFFCHFKHPSLKDQRGTISSEYAPRKYH
jgi:hypothetical protein